MQSYRDQATLYRAALLIGLVQGEAVIRWADEIIHREASPPAPLIELSLTPPGDLSALRHAIQPMTDEKETPAIARALLALAQNDLASGRRSAQDTVRVLTQMRKLITLPYEWRHEIFTIEGQFTQAQVGMVKMADVEARVREWMEQFGGAEREILDA